MLRKEVGRRIMESHFAEMCLHVELISVSGPILNLIFAHHPYYSRLSHNALSDWINLHYALWDSILW